MRSRRGPTREHALVSRLRNKFIACLVLYVLVVAAFILYSVEHEKGQLIGSVDNHLFLAASGLRHMLAEDFHDRAVAPDSIGREEELRNRRRLSAYAAETDLEYVYTVVRYQGRFYFSAPTVTEEEAAERASWYFYPYEDIPADFVLSYGDGRVRYLSYSDQWGTFRSVILPQTSPNGATYLACADYDISHVNAMLTERVWQSLGVAALFLAAGLPFILVFFAYGRRLKRLNLELAESASTLERTVEERTHDLQTAKDAAEKADRSKSEFLAVMSHEVRTPLNAMLGMIDILKGRDLKTEHRRAVNLLDSSGRQLLTVVNDILDISRMDAGRVELQAAPFDIRGLLDEVCAICRTGERPVAIACIMDTGLERCRMGDSMRLRQVLLNLVCNALKFTEAGSVELEVCPSTMDGDDWLLFTVRDTGIGIPDDKLEAIFERFSQADRATSRCYGGSGLGLTISRRLVQLMQGHIWCQSEVGRGATFRFTAHLPAVTPCESCATKPAVAATVDPSSLPRTRVLVADDFEPNYAMVEMFLENTPISTARAVNGREALEKVKQGGWDLVLMDVHMPVMDGVEATRAIRQWERTGGGPRIPVIALTADAMSDHLKNAGPDGFDALLLKPMDQHDLLGAIASLIMPPGTPPAAPPQDRPNGDPESTVVVEEQLRNLLPVFMRSMREGMEDIGAVLTDPYSGAAGRGELIRISHGLKGACLNYGFNELAGMFAAMQAAAQRDDRDEAQRILDEASKHLATASVTFGENQP